MAEHRQVVKALLETIRATPTTTKAQAEALIESAFPGNGQKYLGWYLTWWYKYGVLTAETYSALKNRIAAMDDTQFGYAKGRMAKLADMLAVQRIERDALEAVLPEVQAEIDAFTPKTGPDQVALDFWNQCGPEAMAYNSAVGRKQMIEDALSSYED